ncbi:MAG: S-layer homology domain-containing protein [Clostridia bacterium]|nr:S-layer homology domain-containing protein [Clostridia bacterium]
MKKTVLILTIILGLIQMSAFAAPSVSFVSDSRALDISGTANPGETVSLMVTCPGVSVDSISGDSIASDVVLLYELEADENGNYSGKFTLPEASVAGEYNVIDNHNNIASFYYADENEIAECVKAVNEASETTLDSVLKKYTNDKKILGLNFSEEYNKYQNSANKIMISFIADKATENIGDIQSYFNKSVEAACIAVGDAELVCAMLEDNSLGIELDSSLDAQELTNMFVKIRNDKLSSVSEIIKTFREASAIVKVNSSTKGEMTDVLEEYNDVLELNLTGKYDKLEKVEVNKYLYHRDFDSIEDIQKAFRDAIEKVSDKNESSSSGGGSGSGFGSTTSRVEVTTTPALPSNPTLPPSSVSYFDDLEGCEWAVDYINELASKGIINGVGNKNFAPNDAVTREQYLKMLLGAFGITPDSGESFFKDVENGSWYAPYINWAVSNGIVKGLNDSTFGVGQNVTREQMAVMTVRMLDFMGITLTEGSLGFSDSHAISDYAKDAVSKMTALGILSGMPDGTFAPSGNLTRAQSAKVISLTAKAGA